MPDAPPPADALAVLRRCWGYDEFRPGQAEAVAAVFAGRDALAVLPTGGGKSLLYQVPAVALGGLTLVVSPLVALMEDQVEGLRTRGVPALALHAGLPRHRVDQALTDAEFGRYRLLYLTPERLHTDLFQARVARLPVTLLAVDEAHCISEWGHDFRPAYRRIAEVRPLLGRDGRAAPCLAVTATATPEVRRDVIEQLELRDPAVVVRGFDRPNLVWSVQRVEDKAAKALEVARVVGGSGLVYAGTRRAAEAWAETLRKGGVPAEAYHGGMPTDERTAVQKRWLAGQTRYLAATSAFGMGIDKPDVRAVVHVALPPTLEAYYQEAGRAGRDGQKAHAVLLVADGDEALPRALAEEGHPGARTVQAVYGAAASLGGLAVGAEADGPLVLDAPALARAAGATPAATRAAVDRLAEAGAWEVLPPRADALLVRVLVGADELRRFGEAQRPALARFVDALLRGLPAEAYGTWAEVPLRTLTRRTRLARERLLRGFSFLAERRVLDVVPPGEGLRLQFLGPRAERVSLDAAALDRARRRSLSRIGDVLAYVRGVGCRRRHLLAYFGEGAPARCGRCDVCLGRHRPAVVTPADEGHLRRLLAHVERGDARADWLATEGLPAHRRDALADWLIHEGLVRLADPLSDRFELTPKGLRVLRRG